MGRVGTIEKSQDIVNETAHLIKNGEIEPAHITKSVLVIDEAQDMDLNEFHLVQAMVKQNPDMRVIAVGDDDQNIYEFRGSKSEYMQRIANSKEAKVYELIENYRSKKKIVAMGNYFVTLIKKRMKSTPIQSKSLEDGEVTFHTYPSGQIIPAMIQHIVDGGIQGTLGILTSTNDDAMTIAGALRERGVDAKLIQSNDFFRLSHLDELCFFKDALHYDENQSTISDKQWAYAKRQVKNKYAGSDNYPLIKRFIKDVEATTGKNLYISDFEEFINESRIEDFYDHEREPVLVSTMHKAKGREFDHVIILIQENFLTGDDRKRVLYVAMTRAKTQLEIHGQARYIAPLIAVPQTSQVREQGSYYGPDPKMSLHLTHRDVFLDYFYQPVIQDRVNRLLSGDALQVDEAGCKNERGHYILKFSKMFKAQIAHLKKRGYQLAKGRVRFVFYWQKEGKESKTKIVLPEVILEKK